MLEWILFLRIHNTEQWSQFLVIVAGGYDSSTAKSACSPDIYFAVLNSHRIQSINNREVLSFSSGKIWIKSKQRLMVEAAGLSMIDTPNNNEPQNPSIHLLGGFGNNHKDLNTHVTFNLKDIIGPKVYKDEWLSFEPFF